MADTVVNFRHRQRDKHRSHGKNCLSTNQATITTSNSPNISCVAGAWDQGLQPLMSQHPGQNRIHTAFTACRQKCHIGSSYDLELTAKLFPPCPKL